MVQRIGGRALGGWHRDCRRASAAPAAGGGGGGNALNARQAEALPGRRPQGGTRAGVEGAQLQKAGRGATEGEGTGGGGCGMQVAREGGHNVIM